MAADNLELTIRLSNGTRLPLNVGPISLAVCTVRHVKEKLAHQCPVERQRLIYKGRILEDDRTLQDYGVVAKATLFLVQGQAPPGSTPPAAPASTTTRATTPTANVAVNAPSASAFASAFPSMSTIPPASAPPNPWAAAASGGNNNPMGMNPMMANPEQMQQMMNSPFMSSLLENPQLLQNMMEMQMQSNPAMRQMMESNPAMRQMLNDPSVLRQAVDMMRNPAAFSQAMRNNDLAMSNIENMPGGFAALSNMYRDIQQPMEESMMPPHGSGSSTTPSNTSNPNAGATGSAMPNPWGSTNTMNNSAIGTASGASSQSAAGTPPPNPFAAMMGGGGGAPAANNPFAAMMGGGAGAPGANNPFAAMMGGGAGANNPFAAIMGGGSNSPFASGNNPMAANNPWAGGGMPPQPTPDQLNTAVNMLENPMIQQMMEQALSQNPDYFRNMLTASNPMLAQMFQNNPQAADDLVRSMMNPAVMRSMAQMQQAMGPPSNNNTISAAATAPQGQGIDFSSLLQSMQSSGTTSAPPGPPQTPADRYRNQLRSLYDMGFDDEQQSLGALQAAHGNLNRAVDMLLAGEVPASPQTPTAGGDPQDPPPPSKDHDDKKND